MPSKDIGFCNRTHQLFWQLAFMLVRPHLTGQPTGFCFNTWVVFFRNCNIQHHRSEFHGVAFYNASNLGAHISALSMDHLWAGWKPRRSSSNCTILREVLTAMSWQLPTRLHRIAFTDSIKKGSRKRWGWRRPRPPTLNLLQWSTDYNAKG